MDNRWKSLQHAVFNCAYHFIWCPKYKRKVLVDGVDIRLKELLLEKAQEHGWVIEKIDIMPDRVHVLIKATTVDAPVYIISQLKGYTSSKLRSENKKIKSRLPTLWTRSYYCQTIGHIIDPNIKKYIDDQKNK